MLCDVCKKNPATIHIHEIIDGNKKELNLCAECAAKKAPDGIDITPFNIGEVLFNLEKISSTAVPENGAPVPDAQQPSCPVCRWTLENIRRHGGRLGCPECYNTFRPMIEAALGNIHRGRRHLGKRPDEKSHDNAAALLRLDIADKQRELQAMIAAEEYEKAAGLRDAISALKKKLDDGGGGKK